MIKVRVQLDDLPLVQKCKALGLTLRSGLVAWSLRRALKPIQDMAKSLIPVRTGTARKSIRIVTRTYKDNKVTVGLVGPSRDVVGTDPHGRPIRPTKYAHLIEFGHVITPTKRSRNGGKVAQYQAKHGRYGKRTRPYPFIGPAFETLKDQVLPSLNEDLRNRVEEVWLS